MKLHWRTYGSEFFGEWFWLPAFYYDKIDMPCFPKEVSVFWLKWGYTLRWWRR